jgi:hypothetical protein
MKRFLFGLLLVGLLYGALTMWQPGKAVETMNSATSMLNSLTHTMTLPGGQVQASSTSVEGPPTISATLINQVLAAAGSPASGTGQALSTLGVHYGIDPVYALAFFQHESRLGTSGVARATLSLGNIRCSAGYSCIQGFRAYSSWQAGYADWFQLIRNLYINQWGLRTVEQIIPVYAPASDHNDVDGYIAAILKAVRTWREASQIAVSGV